MTRPLLVSAMVACTADRGQGSTVLSPLSASPERVRVSVTFSSRRSAKRLFCLPASPVQNRRRPGRPSFKGECSFGDGLPNCSFGMPFLRGLPQDSHQLFIGESRGPRATAEWPLTRLTPFHQCRHAQERRRFCTAYAVPVASNSAFEIVSARALRPSYAADVSPRASAEHLTVLPLMPLWTNVWCPQAGRF